MTNDNPRSHAIAPYINQSERKSQFSSKLINQIRSTFKKFIILGLVAIAMTALFQAPSASAGIDIPLARNLVLQSIDCPTQIELDIVDLINQERSDAGLSPLAIDMQITEAARLHSEDMARNNFFSHTGSDGASLGERLTRAGYTWRSAGENIAAGYRSAETAVDAWMGSDGHRANILSTRYDHIGLGYAYNQEATYGRYYTSDFGSSSDGVQPPPDHCLNPSPTPEPTPTPIFSDVPADHWAHAYIEALYRAGYASGCSSDPLLYCPNATMTRAESAVFAERGIHTADYIPSQPVTTVFDDVPLGEWFAKWADALWSDGYTAGCGTDPLIFCPLQGHTRTEGAVFYLRMLNGAGYVPPDPIGIFEDVAIDFWGAKWIEAAYNAGLITACETSPSLLYCPDGPLDRATAAFMMVQAKELDIQ